MDTTLLSKGLLLGFAIAAPVGPIGLLCIRRTLSDGRVAGIATGLGAATADAMYGGVAALGLTALSSLLVGYATWLRLVGGAFLLYLGLRTLLAVPTLGAATGAFRGATSAYLSTLALTISNPMTILAFVALFGAVGVPADRGLPAAVFVAGVFLGSALWWLLLCGLVGAIRVYLRARWLLWINRVSGVVIAAFGLLSLLGPILSRG